MHNSRVCSGLAAAGLVVSLLSGLAPASAQNVAEDRLRAQLRAATVQLRSLQDQNASLQAMQAQAERERMALTEKLSASDKELVALRAQIRTSQSANDAAQERLKAQQDNFVKVDAQNRENFGKLQAAYNETVQVLRSREADATRLGMTLAQTRGRVDACETKNAELYRLGNEVLGLYDNRNVLERLGGVEPFTRLKRVQYENLKQDYEDKLRVNEIMHPIR